ncbi:MAG: heavy metal sensor histidine kinase [Gemmatimonadaceae bacterium]|nr:heavy metal sensor histidine kinase [Gemmatimonadaceae bacterium]
MPISPRRWSISRRLTIAYASSAFVLVACALWLQYRALERNLAEEDDQLLLATSSVVARDLASHFVDGTASLASGSAESVRAVEIVLSKWSAPALKEAPVIRLVSPACETMESSAAIKTGFPPVLCARSTTSGTTLRSWVGAQGIDWRIATTTLTDGTLLDVMLNRHTDTTVLSRSRRQLTIVLLLVLSVSGILGLLIARRGLAPIAHLTARVSRIDARSLDQRLALSDAPAEVDALTSSFDSMLGRLEAAFGALSDYSAELAHELRTPLHVLRQHIEVVLAQPRTTDEYREAMSTNLEEVDRIGRMADDILFLARAQDPRADLETQRLEARVELEAVAEFMDAITDDRGVSITVDAPEGVGFDGNRTLIRRALVNLVSNALAHTSRGGRIRLGASTSADGVRLEVEDTGSGIAPEHLPRIFDRYFRGSDGTGTREGAGLGLAIVRGIAKLHGGTAGATSATGVGSCFRLELPRTPAPGARPSG